MTIPRRKPYFASKTLSGIFKDLSSTADPDIIKQLETSLNHELKLPNPVIVGQGRIGLTLILKASGLKKGTEVIMPGYTFGTLTYIIEKAGFIPVPVDIDPNTYEMSPAAVRGAITKKTSAILATHLFGEPCDIVALKEIANLKKLFLIEDCAQALGTTYGRKLIGTFGDAAFSSFDISKPLQGIRGGVVFSKNKELIKRIRGSVDITTDVTKNPIKEDGRGLFGFIVTQTPLWSIAAYLFSFRSLQKKFVRAYRKEETKKVPYKLPLVYGQIVKNNLKTFKKRLEKRRLLRKMYHDELSKELIFQEIDPKSRGSVYMLLAKIDCDIFKLRRYLAIRGIDIALADEIADDILLKNGSNVSEAIKKSIALPIYEDLTRRDIKRISRHIKRFLSNKNYSLEI